MNEKFELIKNDSIEIDGHKLYRLQALIDFNDVQVCKSRKRNGENKQ